MSGTIEDRPLKSKALELDALAADWIERKAFGPWTAADQTALEAWLQQSSAHRIAFVRMRSGWEKAGRLAILQSGLRQDSHGIPVRHSRMKVFRVALAASACLAVFAGVSTLYTSPPAAPAYSTGIGEREVLSLADGSQIELNTDTALRMTAVAGQRTVWLQHGEAYFHVKHDPNRLFVVYAGDKRITDIGTEFSVRRDTGQVKVAVVDGSVRFEGDGRKPGQKEKVLHKGEVVVATAETTTIIHQSSRHMDEELGWRRGVLIFDRTPLSQAAEEINRYNSKKLIIADPEAGQMKIGGTFPKNNVNAITAAARELFGLHVEDRGTEIVISRH